MTNNNFQNKKLTRHPMKYDHRDYRLLDYITPSMKKRALLISKQDWGVDHVLDQGDTGHCVGFGWAGFGITLPVFDNWDNSMGDKIYYAAKVIDGEPNQEDGSDTRSGVQAFMEFGQLQNNAYAFATSLNDIQTWIKTTGPVVVGTNWYNDMFNPDANGLVSVSGGVAGGHEYVIVGCDGQTGLFHCLNSWNSSFGVNGTFYIKYTDMERLQNEQGDACTAVEISAQPSPAPSPIPVVQDPTSDQNLDQENRTGNPRRE